MSKFAGNEARVKSQLLYLLDETYQNEKNPKIDSWERDNVKDYIDFGEWGLAADTMAFEYLPGRLPLTETISKVFEELAERMELLENDWCHSIRELLSNPQPSAP